MQRGVTHDVAPASPKGHESRLPESVRPAGRPGQAAAPGLTFTRFFTPTGRDPFEEVAWETRSAVIANDKGELVFEQRDVEVPAFWSQQATNIVVSKYFRGPLKPKPGEFRESSVRQLIGRVVDTIADWAKGAGTSRATGTWRGSATT